MTADRISADGSERKSANSGPLMNQSNTELQKKLPGKSTTMTMLIVLGLAQVLFILILLTKVVDLDNRLDAAISTGQEATPGEGISTRPDHGQSNTGPGQLDESRVRRIIREELRAQLNAFSATAPQTDENEDFESVSTTEYQYRLEAAMQDLDFYIQQREISDADMIRLQTDIARLDEQGRREMLGLLAQALSTGELKGNL